MRAAIDVANANDIINKLKDFARVGRLNYSTVFVCMNNVPSKTAGNDVNPVKDFPRFD